jgi:hypothetical protein
VKASRRTAAPTRGSADGVREAVAEVLAQERHGVLVGPHLRRKAQVRAVGGGLDDELAAATAALALQARRGNVAVTSPKGIT